MDRAVARRLGAVSKHLAYDDKIAVAYESGRVYGLRQQKYDMRLKRELDRDWRRAPTEHHW